LARLSNDAGDIFLVDLHEGAFKVRLPQGSYIVIAEGAAIRSVNRKLPSGCASIGRAPAQGFFDNGLNRAATGDAWTRIVIEGPVAEDADTVTVGAMCSGAGSGGFDGVTLDVVD
jgi:hypothetical protein